MYLVKAKKKAFAINLTVHEKNIFQSEFEIRKL